MNIANVTKRFVALADSEAIDVSKYRFIIENAISIVMKRCKCQSPDESEAGRLETLCAVYALRLCEMCNDENITSFTAGDVKIASSAEKNRFEKMWRELESKSQDILKSEKFLFGRVI